MKLPIQFRLERPGAYRPSAQFWWALTENAFKFVEWCLVLGLIEYGYTKTRDATLAYIGGALAILIFITYIKLLQLRLSISLRTRLLSERTIWWIGILVSVLCAVGIVFGGLLIVNRVSGALAHLQSLH